MQFDVRAIAADNAVLLLAVDAADAHAARSQVEARGMTVTSVRPARAGLRVLGRRGGRFPLTLFAQELLALLEAGLSVSEAIEALLEKEGASAGGSVLRLLLDALLEGRRLSDALQAQPDLFPALFIGLVSAAEGTSDLPQALRRFIQYQGRVDQVRNKVLSAAIYPLILMTVGAAVMLFLVGYVVPRFAEVYRGAGRDLPWMSQLLLDWGAYASAHPGALAAVLAATGVLVAFIVARLRAPGGLARITAHLPFLRERVRIYALSRLYLTLGMLLEGGIPIMRALRTAQGAAPPAMAAPLARVRDALAAGAALSAALAAHGLTTPVSLRLIRVGERTGQLGAMLTQSATFYDGETGRWIDRFTRLFEPLLMVVIGLVVGFIVVLLYMPIFDLADSLS